MTDMVAKKFYKITQIFFTKFCRNFTCNGNLAHAVAMEPMQIELHIAHWCSLARSKYFFVPLTLLKGTVSRDVDLR
jgi:hypothetical protein